MRLFFKLVQRCVGERNQVLIGRVLFQQRSATQELAKNPSNSSLALDFPKSIGWESIGECKVPRLVRPPQHSALTVNGVCDLTDPRRVRGLAYEE